MEPLDIEQPGALVGYLRARGRIAPDEQPEVRVLAGGVSNRTVLVRRASGEQWVLKQALEKLRVKADWYSSPERIHREALGLRWLMRLAPAGSVTPLVFEDRDAHILAMDAVPEPHANWKALLLAGQVDLWHANQFGALLGTIHAAAQRERDAIRRDFDDRSFFVSLRAEPYYAYSAEQEPGAAPFLRALIDETLATRLALVHGDYSPKNILVHQGRLVLLDHEVIHYGDPAFDVGFALTHLLSKAHHLPGHRAAMASAARAFAGTYRAALGGLPWSDGLEPRAVRHALGCLLARVVGRSPLEYLDAAEGERQRRAALALMAHPPSSIPALIDAFLAQLDSV